MPTTPERVQILSRIVIGLGTIFHDAVALTGEAQWSNAQICQSADGSHTYRFTTGNLESGGDLLIDSNLRIRNFHNGDLSLNLTTLPIEPPIPDNWIPGDSQGKTGDILTGSENADYFQGRL